MRETLKTLTMLLLAFILLGGILSQSLRAPVAVPVSVTAALYPVIVIDAGHGGMDGGAVGKNGTLERDINLAVAQKTELLLALFGIPTVMTRTTEDDIAPEASYSSIRARKAADMHNRKAIVDAQASAILLSIHMNNFGQSRYSGAQVFYTKIDGSKVLAETLQQNLIGFADPANTRVVMPVDPDLYLYRSVTHPAVLVECGFLSNAAEEAKLKTDSYQTKLAAALAVSVFQHISIP
ncbi:MAG: N-acetylmuramoyl-L-alanine amidase [Clostridiaceae bacterium]|nr:N-acetylmuramoyl-L-alanine amidase [Clostridiaceae bacterium]